VGLGKQLTLYVGHDKHTVTGPNRGFRCICSCEPPTFLTSLFGALNGLGKVFENLGYISSFPQMVPINPPLLHRFFHKIHQFFKVFEIHQFFKVFEVN
jgi:hypothetical protein